MIVFVVKLTTDGAAKPSTSHFVFVLEDGAGSLAVTCEVATHGSPLSRTKEPAGYQAAVQSPRQLLIWTQLVASPSGPVPPRLCCAMAPK